LRLVVQKSPQNPPRSDNRLRRPLSKGLTRNKEDAYYWGTMPRSAVTGPPLPLAKPNRESAFDTDPPRRFYFVDAESSPLSVRGSLESACFSFRRQHRMR
jgi:hypothetical protein